MMGATSIQPLHLVMLTHDKAHRLFRTPTPLVGVCIQTNPSSRVQSPDFVHP